MGSWSPSRFFVRLPVRKGPGCTGGWARGPDRRAPDRQAARDKRRVVLPLSCGARLRPGYPQRYCSLLRAIEALAPGAGRRAAAADEAPGPASMIRCAWCRHTWPRPQPGSAVALRIPRQHVPDADSDRARLPGAGPAPRPGASQDVPGEGLTQGITNAQTRSALVTAV